MKTTILLHTHPGHTSPWLHPLPKCMLGYSQPPHPLYARIHNLSLQAGIHPPAHCMLGYTTHHCKLGYPSPRPHGQAETCKNNTFPQLLLLAAIVECSKTGCNPINGPLVLPSLLPNHAKANTKATSLLDGL